MKTVFEKSHSGERAVTIRPAGMSDYAFDAGCLREELPLPEISEVELVRHYSALSRLTYGVDNGFYPLGSCTMKYNPKLDEAVADAEGFRNLHPLQPEESVQGALRAMFVLQEALKEITGMDGITLEPAAGAHGEYTGLSLIAAYHKSRGDSARRKVIVPDSAHGTNPASAALAGFDIVSVKSNEEKGVDLDDLRAVCDDTTAALMLTNPTTLGLFEKNIGEISDIVHKAGGLLYYDGANLNAVMGVARPGDMGFDVVHLNLHKTFSTPHGGGGPGSGPVGAKKTLLSFLPTPVVIEDNGKYRLSTPSNTIGKVTSFYGNFGVMMKALAYIITLGGNGLKDASVHAVLNANYMKAKLQDLYEAENTRYCMHEFVLSLEKLKEETGVTAIDIAKSLIDCGIHPPTMYFPLIVHEALMFEPTETESKETLDKTIEAMRRLYKEAYENAEYVKAAPHSAVISRPDEVLAARSPKLIY